MKGVCVFQYPCDIQCTYVSWWKKNNSSLVFQRAAVLTLISWAGSSLREEAHAHGVSMAEGDQHMDILPDHFKSKCFTKASCVAATKAVSCYPIYIFYILIYTVYKQYIYNRYIHIYIYIHYIIYVVYSCKTDSPNRTLFHDVQKALRHRFAKETAKLRATKRLSGRDDALRWYTKHRRRDDKPTGHRFSDECLHLLVLSRLLLSYLILTDWVVGLSAQARSRCKSEKLLHRHCIGSAMVAWWDTDLPTCSRSLWTRHARAAKSQTKSDLCWRLLGDGTQLENSTGPRRQWEKMIKTMGEVWGCLFCVVWTSPVFTEAPGQQRTRKYFELAKKSFKVQNDQNRTKHRKHLHHVVLPRSTSAGQEISPNWYHDTSIQYIHYHVASLKNYIQLHSITFWYIWHLFISFYCWFIDIRSAFHPCETFLMWFLLPGPLHLTLPELRSGLKTQSSHRR